MTSHPFSSSDAKIKTNKGVKKKTIVLLIDANKTPLTGRIASIYRFPIVHWALLRGGKQDIKKKKSSFVPDFG